MKNEICREIKTLENTASAWYAHVSVGALPSDAEYIHVVNDKLVVGSMPTRDF